jgi:hypothetical protein
MREVRYWVSIEGIGLDVYTEFSQVRIGRANLCKI